MSETQVVCAELRLALAKCLRVFRIEANAGRYPACLLEGGEIGGGLQFILDALEKWPEMDAPAAPKPAPRRMRANPERTKASVHGVEHDEILGDYPILSCHEYGCQPVEAAPQGETPCTCESLPTPDKTGRCIVCHGSLQGRCTTETVLHQSKTVQAEACAVCGGAEVVRPAADDCPKCAPKAAAAPRMWLVEMQRNGGRGTVTFDSRGDEYGYFRQGDVKVREFNPPTEADIERAYTIFIDAYYKASPEYQKPMADKAGLRAVLADVFGGAR